MLETPPKKEKSPENNAAEEEEGNTATDAENPTKIDVAAAMQSEREQPRPDETHPGKTDDGRNMPTPDESQSPNFET